MKSSSGFTLIEVMIAIIIMAMIGIMSWRGLDASLRAKESIEQHMTEHQVLQKFITLWQSDCKNLPAGLDNPLPSFITGKENFWMIKHVSTIQSQGWQIILYSLKHQSLTRSQSNLYTARADMDDIWQSILKNPDVRPANFQDTLEIKDVIQQVFQASYQNQISGTAIKPGLIGLEGKWQFNAINHPLISSCLIENQL